MLAESEIDWGRRQGYASLIPPGNLSITSNYEASLAFILDFRSLFHEPRLIMPGTKTKLSVYAEFAEINSIEPAAGLVLAAEIDRWRISSGKRPTTHDAEWNSDVKRFFVQAGLFELLGIDQQESSTDRPSQGGTETLKFVRGHSVHGEPGSRLRDGLEAMCGSSIGPRKVVYDAIAEAIANTRHAYPAGTAIWPLKMAGRWWAAGTWTKATNVALVQLYDQGVGIPATLPRSEHWSDVVRLVGLRDRLHPERRDDRLIEAALEVGRTSTGEQGRGKGLAEMAAWIERRGSGFLRIRSGHGVVTYRAGGNVEGRLERVPFPGTLIEWEVDLGG